MHNYSLMRSRTSAALIIGLLFIPYVTAGPSTDGVENASGLVMNRIADYPLPGRATRWDYMSLDPLRSRLFIAHLGDSTVVVFDTDSNAVVGTIANIGEVHGTLAVPDLGRVYATATMDNEVVAIDARSLKILARIPTGQHPDGLAYAPDVHKLYVSDESGKTETVIDVQTNNRVATIQLGGDVGNTQYDPFSKHIFVNVQGVGELIEIDPRSDMILRRIPIPGVHGNHGLLIEPDLRLAFIADEDSNRLLVMDLNSTDIVAESAVGKGPDVLAYDPVLEILYVASESGVISEFKVSEQGVSKIDEIAIGSNAHTIAVDPATHKLYLPLKVIGKRSVLRVIQPVL
jgi:YVTN family beta-propeller protein